MRRRQRDEKGSVSASNGVSTSALQVSRAAVPASNGETMSNMEKCTNSEVNSAVSQNESVAVAENEESSRDAKCVNSTDGASTSSPTITALPDDRPVQKNKKRCWNCKAKLELAQRELGQCKCGEYMNSDFSEVRIKIYIVLLGAQPLDCLLLMDLHVMTYEHVKITLWPIA